MLYIMPSRVSIYDFLYQDMQPLVPMVATWLTISQPQARYAIACSLQGYVSGLLSYQQRHTSKQLLAKLLKGRCATQLSQFRKIDAEQANNIAQLKYDVADVLFINQTNKALALQHIQKTTDIPQKTANQLFSFMCNLANKEFANIVDKADIDAEKLTQLFALQPQYWQAGFYDEHAAMVADNIEDEHYFVADRFDGAWHGLTKFSLTQHQKVLNSLQANVFITKSLSQMPQTISNNSEKVEKSERVALINFQSISLPKTTWLFDYAKTVDDYLDNQLINVYAYLLDDKFEDVSSKQVQETDEPARPSKTTKSLSELQTDKPSEVSSQTELNIEYDEPKPFWLNPVVMVSMVSLLALLSVVIYQNTQTEEVPEATANESANVSQDVAIVKIDDDTVDELDSTPVENENTQ